MGAWASAFTLVAVISALLVGVTALWLLQSTMAERGRLANPDATDRAERLDELDSERHVARRMLRVLGPVAAVAIVVAVLLQVAS